MMQEEVEEEGLPVSNTSSRHKRARGAPLGEDEERGASKRPFSERSPDRTLYDLNELLQHVLTAIGGNAMVGCVSKLFCTGDRRMRHAIERHLRSMLVTTCSWSCTAKCQCVGLGWPFYRSLHLHSLRISLPPKEETAADRFFAKAGPTAGKTMTMAVMARLPPRLKVLYVRGATPASSWWMSYSTLSRHLECYAHLTYLKVPISCRNNECLDFSKFVNLKALVTRVKNGRARIDSGAPATKWILPPGLETFSGMSYVSEQNVTCLPRSITAVRCNQWMVPRHVSDERLPSLVYMDVTYVDEPSSRLPSTLAILRSEMGIRIDRSSAGWPASIVDFEVVETRTPLSIPAQRSGVTAVFPPNTTALRSAPPYTHATKWWPFFVSEPCFTKLVILSMAVSVSLTNDDNDDGVKFGDVSAALKRAPSLTDLTATVTVTGMVLPALPLVCTRSVKRCRISYMEMRDMYPFQAYPTGTLAITTNKEGFDDFSCLEHLTLSCGPKFPRVSVFGTRDAPLSPNLVVCFAGTKVAHDSGDANEAIVHGCAFKAPGQNRPIFVHSWLDVSTGDRKCASLRSHTMPQSSQTNPFAVPCLI